LNPDFFFYLIIGFSAPSAPSAPKKNKDSEIKNSNQSSLLPRGSIVFFSSDKRIKDAHVSLPKCLLFVNGMHSHLLVYLRLEIVM
jgi:hypothetical protein